MDFLRSLGLDDLPEQQTRTMHLMGRNPEFDLRLGFDACCSCGAPLNNPSSTVIDCPQCQRVSYCSETCRKQDADPSSAAGGCGAAEEQEEESAMGHSSIICTLLKLCNIDEAVSGETAIDENNKTMLRDLETKDPTSKEAAIDRVRSELESYPATLANVLLQGKLYEPAIENSNKNLVIHIIGASQEGELWNHDSDNISRSSSSSNNSSNNIDVWNAYADALSELSESRRLDSIELHFIGPECPKTDLVRNRTMKAIEGAGGAGQLLAETHRGEYTLEFLKQKEITKADLVVLFNPGLTCPDYDWSNALNAIPKGTPFLMTTNTELEGIADCQYLLENDLIQEIPPMLAEIFGEESHNNSSMEEDGSGPFFNENPFCGNRVRQSGTMANDLFVKNRWMLGGILASKTKQPPNKRGRRVTTGGGNNSKASNPALI